MQAIHLKNQSYKKPIEFESMIPENTIKIVLGTLVVIAGICIAGKMLRLMGDAIHDVRYFVKAVNNS